MSEMHWDAGVCEYCSEINVCLKCSGMLVCITK